MTPRKFNYDIVIFSVGFFSLLAQTLLFRDFMAVFQGNEISSAIFFFSWLLWIGVGAFLGRLPWLSKQAVKIYELLLWLYVPAYLLQKALLFNARALVGTSEYELIAFWPLAGVLTLFNSPVSLVTGFLFVSGASWIKNTALPTARMYVFDALGSFAGALAVTLLLYVGICDESVFLLAVLLPGLAALLHNYRKNISKSRKTVITCMGLLSLLFAVSGACGFGLRWHDVLGQKQWQRMLPDGNFQGSFSTPQAAYHYGDYRGEFSVLRWNGICENLPNYEGAWAAAAENLAEKPHARRILVIGSGAFALCRNLCEIPSIEQVVWLDTDPDYPDALLKIVPPQYRKGPDKLTTPRRDVRAYLNSRNGKFDLIINMLPAPGALSLNRYYSADFYHLQSKALRRGGVLSVAFPGGENFMGAELKMIGASLLQTLQKCFKNVVLKPGSASCFFASDSDVLTVDGQILQKRLAATGTLAQNFPPPNIYTLFDPFRADFQLQAYRETIKNHAGKLINSDEHPLTSRFAMLFALKKSGFGAVFPEAGITSNGLFRLLVWGMITLMVLRLLLHAIIRKTQAALPRFCDGRIPGADIMFFIWITSIMAMCANILLIYAFQVACGSIFLYFGLVSALFMSGLFIGGQISSVFFSGKTGCRFSLFSLLLIILFGVLRISALRFADVLLLALGFLITGTVCALWLPRAAAVLQYRQWHERSIAWQLWSFDSLGGAIGGLLCAGLLLPMLGTLRTLDILLLVSVILLILSVTLGSSFSLRAKKMLIVLTIFLINGFAVANDMTVVKTAEELKPRNATLTVQAAKFNGKVFNYYKVQGPGNKKSYIFDSAQLVKGINGYGGEIRLLLYVDDNGKLLNFKVLKHHETAQLYAKVKARKAELLGKNIFDSATAFKGDGVTGATYSSKALVKTINAAGKGFKALLDGKPSGDNTDIVNVRPPPGGARNIDATKYRELISRDKLSDHKALYFKKTL